MIKDLGGSKLFWVKAFACRKEVRTERDFHSKKGLLLEVLNKLFQDVKFVQVHSV